MPVNPFRRTFRHRRPWSRAVLSLVGIAAVAAIGAVALHERPEPRPADRTAFDPTHAAWTRLLGQYVNDGVVDYTAATKEAGPVLNGYLATLESVTAPDYETWTPNQRIAYWINVYNAYTLRLVLDHFPIQSIRSIGLLPGAAWRKSFIPLQALRGRTLSLNDVEHEILRKEFREPRIHFAIVCASVSCPALRSEAYTGEALDAQLDDATRGFVQDPTKNRYEDGSLYLSSIFDWFRDDFERNGQTPAGFVGPYLEPEVAAAVQAHPPRISFLDYDWSLNGK